MTTKAEAEQEHRENTEGVEHAAPEGEALESSEYEVLLTDFEGTDDDGDVETSDWSASDSRREEEVAEQGEPETPEAEQPEQAAEAEPTTEESTPETAIQPEQTPTEQQAQTEQPQQPQQPTQEQQQPQQPQWDPEEAARQVEAWEKSLEPAYAISQEDADLLLTDPDKVLPRMAARLHRNVMESVMHSFQQFVPSVVHATVHQREAVNQAKETFYSKWPDLRQHEQLVEQVATMQRQLNPQLSMEELHRQVGLQASVMLQLPIPGVTDQAPAETPPADPNVQPAPQTPPPPPPRGAGHVPPPPRPPQNPYTQLAEEFIEDM